MIKNNKRTLIITSVITLLPVFIGLLLWNKLPDKVATHWNLSGEVDGWSSKAFAVFFLPLFLLAFHWICVLGTSFDKKNQGQNRKILGIVLWIVPIISLLVSSAVYAIALGYSFNMSMIGLIIVGFGFIIIGNYMPKTAQNRTIGIKIKWTLESEENWNATHRFCGKVWVIGGIALMFCAFLPTPISEIAFVTSVILLVIIPIVYSYVYHKKKSRQ